MGSCSVCDYVGIEMHVHHIVPVSLGGTECPANLVELCIQCHQKAHNAKFGGDSGIIKAGIAKTKRRWKDATAWLSENEGELHKILLDFYEVHDTSVITDLLYYNAIKADDLHTWLKFGKGVARRPFGELPSMLHRLYRDNAEEYSLVIGEEDFSKFGR